MCGRTLHQNVTFNALRGLNIPSCTRIQHRDVRSGHCVPDLLLQLPGVPLSPLAAVSGVHVRGVTRGWKSLRGEDLGSSVRSDAGGYFYTLLFIFPAINNSLKIKQDTAVSIITKALSDF